VIEQSSREEFDVFVTVAKKQIPLSVPRPPNCGGKEKRGTSFGMTVSTLLE
jgi:hypothetical protein